MEKWAYRWSYGTSKDWGRVAYDEKSSAYCGKFMNLLI